MASTSLFMLSQVGKHKSKNDCWLVIDGRVLNVTRFLEEHPGGDVVILDIAGKDVTTEFQASRHSKAAWNLLLKYQVSCGMSKCIGRGAFCFRGKHPRELHHSLSPIA